MGNDRDYRKQVGINYHPMTKTFSFTTVRTGIQ